MKIPKPLKWCYVGIIFAILFPLMVIGQSFNLFWEWWHFGPSQRILNFAREIGADKKVFKAVFNLKEMRDWVNKG